MRNKISIYDIDFDNITMQQALEEIVRFIKNKRKGYVVTPNIDHVTKRYKNKEFQQAYKHASMVLPDGMPIVWVSKLLGKPIVEKVSGSDLFILLLGIAEREKFSIFFLGSPQESSREGVRIIREMYPNLKIAGRYSPPMYFEKNPEENKKVTEMINKAKPDILFVLLTPPRQEIWAYKNIKNLDTHIAICVGASLDYVSGHVKRAPKWMQDYGAEWIWRMFQKPETLVKRYLVENMFPFIWLTIKAFLKNDRNIK